jgi:hypothetical protein
MVLDSRLILFHTQPTSGRTRFLRFPHGLLAFEALPPDALWRAPGGDDAEVQATEVVRLHPAAPLRAAEERLGLSSGTLAAEGAFYAEVSTATGMIPVLLARFTTTDPPFAVAESLQGRFLTLTEVRGLLPLEMALLREAYEVILG